MKDVKDTKGMKESVVVRDVACVMTWLVALLVSADVIAQQPNPEAYARTLEGPERVARMQVPRVVEALGIKTGDRVADIGSGSGLFTPVARAAGRVAVIDFSERWPAGHESMRFTTGQLDGWMKDAGSYDWLDNSFFIVYRKSGPRPRVQGPWH